MNFKEAFSAEVPNEDTFLRTLSNAHRELTLRESASAPKIAKAVADVLGAPTLSEKTKYYALHVLNICVLSCPGALNRAMQSELKDALLKLALTEPRKGTAAQKAKRIIQKSGGNADENYTLYLLELLLECIEFWHVNDELNEHPTFKEMYCELVKQGVIFVEDPAHVLKYVDFVERLKHEKKAPPIKEESVPRDMPSSLESSKVRNVLLKDSIDDSKVGQRLDSFAGQQEALAAMEAFNKVYSMILGTLKTRTNGDPMVNELLGTLEECIQSTSKVKEKLSKTDLAKLRDGLFILNAHYQNKDYGKMRRLVLETLAKDAKLTDSTTVVSRAGPKLAESITSPYQLTCGNLGSSLLGSKAASPPPNKRSLQTTNCTISFKAGPPPKRADSLDPDMTATVHPNSSSKKRSKQEIKSTESIKETISFRSFDVEKNESPHHKGGNVFKDDAVAGNYLAQFVENERKSLKSKISNLKSQLVENKEKYEKEIENLREKLKSAEATIATLQEENKKLKERVVVAPEGKPSARHFSPKSEIVSTSVYGLNGVKSAPKDPPLSLLERDTSRAAGRWGSFLKEPAPGPPPYIYSNELSEPTSKADLCSAPELSPFRTSILHAQHQPSFSPSNPYFPQTSSSKFGHKDIPNFDLVNANLTRCHPSIPTLPAPKEIEKRDENIPDFIKMFNQEIDGILTKKHRRLPSTEDSFSRGAGKGGPVLAGRGMPRESDEYEDSYLLRHGQPKENLMGVGNASPNSLNSSKAWRSNSLSGGYSTPSRLVLNSTNRVPLPKHDFLQEADSRGAENRLGILRFQKPEK